MKKYIKSSTQQEIIHREEIIKQAEETLVSSEMDEADIQIVLQALRDALLG